MRLSPPSRPFLFLFSCGRAGCRLANGRGLKHGCNALEYAVHTQVGVDGGIHGVMGRAGVHDQDFRSFVSLLDHVGQVMPVLLRQGGAEDDEVKGVAAKGFLNTVAVKGSRDMMPSFGDFGGLRGESMLVAFAVENLDGGFLSRRGHGPSLRTHWELINWRGCFLGHGRTGPNGGRMASKSAPARPAC